MGRKTEAGIRTVRLKKKEDRRVRRGHPWVFSNELESKLSGMEPGELVEVVDHSGRPVGMGYANPNSLIAVRMLTRGGGDVGPGLILERVATAKALRERLYPGRETYRAVFSESDLLPGLVVDRYGSWLVLQVLTAGMERMMPWVLDALREAYRPEGIVLRNDSSQRRLEGLTIEKRVLEGEYPGAVTVSLAGILFNVDMLAGQKTGFFLDQVDNYRLLDRVVQGAEVLDLFCHTGAWGLYAAKAGADAVIGVDSSATALGSARENAALNNLTGGVSFIEEDAFDYLKRLTASGKKHGVVVVDPPAFVKSRAKIAEGLKGYMDLNVRAMKAVAPGGFLISASCSHHVGMEGFKEVLRAAAAGAGRAVRLIEMRSQSGDHPVLIVAPETEYLKCALMQVL